MTHHDTRARESADRLRYLLAPKERRAVCALCSREFVLDAPLDTPQDAPICVYCRADYPDTGTDESARAALPPAEEASTLYRP